MNLHMIFYLFACVAVFSGLMVTVSGNPVRSVLFLVLTFFSTAGIWMILHAEFLSLILVLVYVGAVMTLFLFVVMMLSVHMENREGFVRYFPLGLLVVAFIFTLTYMTIGSKHFGLQQASLPVLNENYNNLASLGSILYTDYVYPFEIAAVILLAAIIAAISLAHRKPVNRRTQVISEQIAVKREERVRLVKMPTERKSKSTGSGE